MESKTAKNQPGTLFLSIKSALNVQIYDNPYWQRIIFFGIVFKEIFGRKKSKDECSKTIKPISKFLSHIKCTWIKLRIHNTFTKFSKSLHIPFKNVKGKLNLICNSAKSKNLSCFLVVLWHAHGGAVTCQRYTHLGLMDVPLWRPPFQAPLPLRSLSS